MQKLSNSKKSCDYFSDYTLRPIKKSDLTDLCKLATESGTGFTSLPNSREALSIKIKRSIESFSKDIKDLTSEYYLFGLEYNLNNQIVGVCAIESNVGVNELFYHYKIGKLTKATKTPPIRKTHEILTLSSELNHTTEICTLFLLPEHRKPLIGQFLSRSRFLFLKRFPERFTEEIIAEMRGVCEKDGTSPFWSALGSKFIDLSFPDADYLKGRGDKQFITDLIPETRIYSCMMPANAQKCISKTHKNTTPAKILLEKEGFKFEGYIDLFDAGPTMHANISNIKTCKITKNYHIQIIDNNKTKSKFILSNNKISWRAVLAEGYVENNKLHIRQKTAHQLNLNDGDLAQAALINT